MTKPAPPLDQNRPSAAEAARLFAKDARRPARSMKRPSRALRQILRPMGKKFGGGVYELQLRWNDIAGHRLAPVCKPEQLSGNKHEQTLTIRAKGSAAMLIQAQSAQLLERVNLVVGGGRVRKIRIVQGRMGDTKPAAPVPLQKPSCKPEQLAALDKQLSDISDPALKAALLELGIGVLAKQQNG
ncbi:hypothetical protein MNBD_ALPHA06-1030 [hydrothermal vent metagenome]|uniref:Zn-ribbon-containing, possibly RNA-binding protein and truncated derivatives n=1 Tax=hydrothermal vent metagenome TaxID=652676 RepID=A0A3B0SJI7_9ZZZZ